VTNLKYEVYRLNKYYKHGLLYLSFFAIFSLVMGCSLFGGLDDAQKTSATFVNSFFAKGEKPTAEVRYQKLVSTISANMKDSPATAEAKPYAIQFISKFMKQGLYKNYFIADHPTEPQTDTRRTIVVKFPANSLGGDGNIFGDGTANNKESFGQLVLNKEGDNWKITEIKDADTQALQKADVDWKEVKPTDYLN
jgi:hypothetical protein